MHAILIPVKRLNEAKARLAAEISAEQRHRLGVLMLSDVLAATSRWDHRWVVTSDPAAAELAKVQGCSLIDDPDEGLNQAIAAGTAAAAEAGATRLLVLPADVPLVESDDLLSAFEVDAAIGIAASRDGGTNLLFRRPPDAIKPQFGRDSARRHAAAARSAGLELEMLDVPSLLLDVDQPEDLWRLASSDSERESALYVRSILETG